WFASSLPSVIGSPHWTVATSVGESNVTVTRNVSDALLPASSVAVPRTGVVPTGNVLPLAGEHETPTLPLTASVAVGDGQETAAPSAFAVVTDLSPRTLSRTGAVL